jgi:hypothetical protein
VAGIDADGAHAGEIDDDPSVAGAVAGDVVAASADRDLEALAAREANRLDDVRHAFDASDDRRMAVDGAVPDPASGVVFRIARRDDLARQRRAEECNIGWMQKRHGSGP